MLDALTSLGLFFKFSPKRQRHLETSIEAHNTEQQRSGKATIKKSKFKTMCQTRWIERHTTLEDFKEMYPALCSCLEDIASNRDRIWNAKAITEANGILHSITNPCFIAAFEVNFYIFGFTKHLSVLLQGSTMDLIHAYSQIDQVKKILQDLRKDTSKEFCPIFQSMLNMAEIAHLEGVPAPRRCSRQTARSNIEAQSDKEYWRRTIFVPFLDHLLQEFGDRFSQLTQDAVKGFHLIPAEAPKLSESVITTLVERFQPSSAIFNQEIRRWKLLWTDTENPPSSLRDTVSSDIICC